MFDFTTFPVLENERLILREIVLADAEAIFAIRGDYEVTKFNIGAPYADTARAQKLIVSMKEQYLARDEIRWGITLKPNDEVIGMVGYNYWDRKDNRGSVGFDLNRKYWRRGIMAEALRMIVVFGFDEMGLNRIEADASIHNSASINLMKSLGFVQEGVQREQYYEDGVYHDLVLLSLLRRDWIYQHLSND
jgi:[ribosomal protein S5]-alanine N-acetyltransferase